MRHSHGGPVPSHREHIVIIVAIDTITPHWLCIFANTFIYMWYTRFEAAQRCPSQRAPYTNISYPCMSLLIYCFIYPSYFFLRIASPDSGVVLGRFFARAQHKIYSLSFLLLMLLLLGTVICYWGFFFQRILDFLILRVAQAKKRGETSHLLGGYGRLQLGPRGQRLVLLDACLYFFFHLSAFSCNVFVFLISFFFF